LAVATEAQREWRCRIWPQSRGGLLSRSSIECFVISCKCVDARAYRAEGNRGLCDFPRTGRCVLCVHGCGSVHAMVRATPSAENSVPRRAGSRSRFDDWRRPRSCSRRADSRGRAPLAADECPHTEFLTEATECQLRPWANINPPFALRLCGEPKEPPCPPRLCGRPKGLCSLGASAANPKRPCPLCLCGETSPPCPPRLCGRPKSLRSLRASVATPETSPWPYASASAAAAAEAHAHWKLNPPR
jgi:hypothetical protein